MENGDRYVAYSQNTLYRLPGASCNEGDTIVLNNTNVERVFLVNGQWVVADNYNLNNYVSTSYVCHVWSPASPTLNINDLILPSVIIVFLFFAIIYKWFIRLRG